MDMGKVSILFAVPEKLSGETARLRQALYARHRVELAKTSNKFTRLLDGKIDFDLVVVCEGWPDFAEPIQRAVELGFPLLYFCAGASIWKANNVQVIDIAVQDIGLGDFLSAIHTALEGRLKKATPKNNQRAERNWEAHPVIPSHIYENGPRAALDWVKGFPLARLALNSEGKVTGIRIRFADTSDLLYLQAEAAQHFGAVTNILILQDVEWSFSDQGKLIYFEAGEALLTINFALGGNRRDI